MNDRFLANEESIAKNGEISGPLLHPSATGSMLDSANLDTACWNIDDEQDKVSNQAKGCRGLDRIKSMAARSSQWAQRKVFRMSGAFGSEQGLFRCLRARVEWSFVRCDDPDS